MYRRRTSASDIDAVITEGVAMRAARYYDRGDIRIEDIAEPEVVPGTVGIDVAWCGICLLNTTPSPRDLVGNLG